eukprot:g23541.t1
MLQFLFMIIDIDRNGTIEKEELLNFFSYIPAGADDGRGEPVFPVNNKNALEYIAYPAYHTQDMYRKILLGKAFWERLDYERIKYQTVVRSESNARDNCWERVLCSMTKRVRMPFTKKKIEVKLPGRCTMQELLEYSRRNTAVQGGKRVTSQDAGEAESTNMIRNPRCMYYIPQESGKNIQKQKGHRSELDVGEQDMESDGEGEMDVALDDAAEGVMTGAPNNAEHMLQIVTAMQMKQNERVQLDDESSDEDPGSITSDPAMSHTDSLIAAVASVTELFTGFVANPSSESRLRARRNPNVAMNAADPLDFVGKTGKRIEANSENEQLVDLDNFWAIFFTIAGVAATYFFVTFIQGFKPT